MLVARSIWRLRVSVAVGPLQDRPKSDVRHRVSTLGSLPREEMRWDLLPVSWDFANEISSRVLALVLMSAVFLFAPHVCGLMRDNAQSEEVAGRGIRACAAESVPLLRLVRV